MYPAATPIEAAQYIIPTIESDIRVHYYNPISRPNLTASYHNKNHCSVFECSIELIFHEENNIKIKKTFDMMLQL